MTGKRLAAVVGVVALIAVVGVLVVGTAFAQTGTPGTPTTPKGHAFGFGEGPGFMNGGWIANFDAMAKALNLTPTQLFEQLHSGTSLADIAKAQSVDLTKIQEAATATRIQAMKDRIAQAVTAGTMTKAQADWFLQGLDNGYMGKGPGGFGGGHMGRGGMRGFGGQAPSQTPGRTAPGTKS